MCTHYKDWITCLQEHKLDILNYLHHTSHTDIPKHSVQRLSETCAQEHVFPTLPSLVIGPSNSSFTPCLFVFRCKCERFWGCVCVVPGAGYLIGTCGSGRPSCCRHSWSSHKERLVSLWYQANKRIQQNLITRQTKIRVGRLITLKKLRLW